MRGPAELAGARYCSRVLLQVDRHIHVVHHDLFIYDAKKDQMECDNKRSGASLLLGVQPSALATNPITYGYVRILTFRGEYAMFKVVSADGTNQCQPCPADPANFSSGTYCWIRETDKTKVSALMLARAQGAMISGRVSDLATNCTMYQLTMHD